MNREYRIYNFGHHSKACNYTVAAGSIVRTYADFQGVVAVIKHDNPLQEKSVTTRAEILPTKFSELKQFKLGEPVRVPSLGGWVHVYDAKQEKVYQKTLTARLKAEKEFKEAQRASFKAYQEDEDLNLKNSYLSTETSGHILESLLGQKLLKFCKSREGYLTLEFETTKVTVSFDGNYGTLTINTGTLP